ncbi:MAG TPA: SRPBCC family protein [Polyangiaceae bacterium]|nr:SRPBCC family protein [Polyangiaceae bacterium]
MKIDIVKQVGAVTRAVHNVEREGRPARAILASRVYDTTPDDLWDALTNRERIPRWFLPISGELRLGGRYQLEGNAGGEITRCDPPRHLALTWEYAGEVSWVTVRLSEASNATGTLLELEHLAHVPPEFWEQFGPGAVGVGWDLALVGLDRHLASGAAVDPQAAQAWSMSEEGKEFQRSSSDRWRQASVESGTDPEQARASAERTKAFYTGEGGEGGGSG